MSGRYGTKGLRKRRASKERFLTAQANRFAGTKRKEKASACSVRNDGGGLSRQRYERGGDRGGRCLGDSLEVAELLSTVVQALELALVLAVFEENI